MGRARKNEICPVCGEPGYLEKKPIKNKNYPNAKTTKIYSYMVHYDSITKKKNRHYIDRKRWISQNEAWIHDQNKRLKKLSTSDLQDDYTKLLKQNLGFDRREKKAIKNIMECIAIEKNIPLYRYKKVSAEVPPSKLQGESELYHKIGDLSEYFFKIGRKLKKIQKDIYQFKPDEKISSECVNDLNEFETKLLIPLEKLLIPYGNKEWSANWTEWIKIQLDNLSLGPNYTAKLHARPTGEYELKTNEEGETILQEIKGSMTSKQIKKNQKKVMEFAYQLIQANPLERALTKYYNNTSIR